MPQPNRSLELDHLYRRRDQLAEAIRHLEAYRRATLKHETAPVCKRCQPRVDN